MGDLIDLFSGIRESNNRIRMENYRLSIIDTEEHCMGMTGPLTGFLTRDDLLRQDVMLAVSRLSKAYAEITAELKANGENMAQMDVNHFLYARRKLERAIRYLQNPDRYMRPKRRPAAVKTGRSRWDNPGRKDVVKKMRETPFERNERQLRERGLR
jgi:hypothetical protein